MEYLFIYLLHLTGIMETTAILSSIFGFFLWAFYFVFSLSDSNEDKSVAKALKPWAVTCLIVMILSVIVPTKETLILMGGTYLGKKAVNQVVTSQKLEKVNTIIDLQLDKYIKELKEVTK